MTAALGAVDVRGGVVVVAVLLLLLVLYLIVTMHKTVTGFLILWLLLFRCCF